MSTVTTPAGRLEPAIAARDRTGGLGHVLAFAGLSVSLAAAATLGGVPSTLVPFVLALGPTAFALVFAWHEGDGGVAERGPRDEGRIPDVADHREHVSPHVSGQVGQDAVAHRRDLLLHER